MKNRFLPLLSVLLLSLLAGLLATPVGAADEAETTEDIIYMVDGRELHGHILSESRSEIVFEYVDRDLKLRTKLKLDVDEIEKIERDVPIELEAEEEAEEIKPRKIKSSGSKDDDEEERERTYGSMQGEADDESLPSFYIVPMKGQMGTDVNETVYREMLDDIRELEPTYLLIVMECTDFEQPRTAASAPADRGERGFTGSEFLDMYREIVSLFHDELRDIPQVLWIEDSVGISSVVALSWDNIYMKPEARFGGISGTRAFFELSDTEKAAKFREAYLGWLKGFVEYGGHSLHLIDAMVLPAEKLSATWKGRVVEWTLDTRGEYVVDSSEERSVNFFAKDAENLCLSKGTAENLDDLALLLGIREYRVMDSEGEQVFDTYHKSWRRSFENCVEWWDDYNLYMSRAGGDEAIGYLGKAKKTIERMLAATKRHEAVKIRLMTDLGLRQFDLETIIEQLKIQIASLRQGRGRGGGGGGRGGGSGGGPGGGG